MADLSSIIHSLRTRDRAKDKKPSYRVIRQEISIIELVLKVVNLLVGSNSIVPVGALRYLLLLKKHLQLRSIEQASLLSMIMNNSDNSRIRLSDLAKQYGVPTLKIIDYISEIDDLVNKRVIIRRRDSDSSCCYRISENVIRDIRMGHLPTPRSVEGLSTAEFYDEISMLVDQYKERELDNEQLKEAINSTMDANRKLAPVQYLYRQHLDYEDILLVLVMANLFLCNNDDEISRYDLSDFFNHRNLTAHCHLLESGTHVLIQNGVVEHNCAEGQVDPSCWRLSANAKSALLQDVKVTSLGSINMVSKHDNIKRKHLYFNDRVSSEINQLKALLKPRRFAQVQKRLESEGLRKGFACLFYGMPGTGKTETVLQLSRETKRDIIVVDVPNIRSKWVGDTEKNIKSVFDRYRSLVKECKMAPILLFNEADAIFGKRKEDATDSVDKMENATQNIILQEMEQLEGILIATTNLCGNLDPAFERRFLYKIEFDRPSPAERQHIWRSMLPDLSKSQALELANNFDFSGGQIENIARKRIVHDILSNKKELDMASIIASCKAELIKKSSRKAIGFGAI